MIKAEEALQRLQEGNRRFSTDLRRPNETHISQVRREELVQNQEPFAIVLGCSDSRVPVEIVFDQGLGDLFVIRVAGNIAVPSVISSIEYAVTRCGTRLIVVLGHSSCGAVLTTIQHHKKENKDALTTKNPIIDFIMPSVEQTMKLDTDQNVEALVEKVVKANINCSIESMQRDSDILRPLIKNDGLQIVGAEYALETGCVHFFESVYES